MVAGGKEFIKKILEILRVLTAGYNFPIDHVPLHMVISRGNRNPYHQDKLTGKDVFDESHEKDTIGQRMGNSEMYTIPSYGLRVLIDLGSFDEDHSSREFKIAIQGSDGYVEKLVTKKRIIAMNAGAAGSAGRSPYFHARFGDGITIQVDLSLEVTGLNARGRSKNTTGGKALNFIRRKMNM